MARLILVSLTKITASPQLTAWTAAIGTVRASALKARKTWAVDYRQVSNWRMALTQIQARWVRVAGYSVVNPGLAWTVDLVQSNLAVSTTRYLSRWTQSI